MPKRSPVKNGLRRREEEDARPDDGRSVLVRKQEAGLCERHEDVREPDREHETDERAQAGEQEALDQQLPPNASRGGAEGPPNCHLALPFLGTHDEQARCVRAREEQHTGHDPEEQPSQSSRSAATAGIQRGVDCGQRARRRASARGVSRSAPVARGGDRIELRLRLLDCRLGREAAHNLEPSESPRRQRHLPGETRAAPGVRHRHRYPEIGDAIGGFQVEPGESRWGDAGDGETDGR